MKLSMPARMHCQQMGRSKIDRLGARGMGCRMQTDGATGL